MTLDTSFSQSVAAFIADWNSARPTMTVHTSGSTGKPKAIEVEKARMAASARMTCEFLGLRPGQSALLCLPVDYIAGKMVIVRALTCGLRLLPVEPSNRPLSGLDKSPDFAAFVPSQVYETLRFPEEARCLEGIGQTLIGGGAIAPDLQERLRNLPNPVWSTYGMTETLSHVALRRLNGPGASDWYTPLPGVEVGQDASGCLTVYAPRVNSARLTTHDLAELRPDGQFRILGRKDNTIISGGVKIQLEDVETALRPSLTRPFIATSVPDEKYGEILVLLIEGCPMAEDLLNALCAKCLPVYHRPKHYFFLDRLPVTVSGKPARKEARAIAHAMAGR